MERTVVFGASNAAGFYGMGGGTDYNIAGVLAAVQEKAPFIQENSSEIQIDLSQVRALPKGSETVMNAAVPGKTLHLLAGLYRREVLTLNPTTLILWPGVNDIRMAGDITTGGEAYQGLHAGKVRELMSQEPEHRVRPLVEYLYSFIQKMVDQANAQNTRVILGTLPPFSNRLASVTEISPELAQYLRGEGTNTIEQLNEQIKLTSDVEIVDFHSALVDPSTRLMRPEYTLNEHRFEDYVHLNNHGQLLVAAGATSQIHHKSVSILSRDRQTIESQYNHPA